MNSGISKKVLVTGASGLIGKELIEALKNAGFDIYAISTKENSEKVNVNWINGTLFDGDFIKATMSYIKPEYLLNLAWATTGDYLKSSINYKFLKAGITLIEEFAKNGGKRAVYAGTCFEYKFKDSPLKENDDLDSSKTTYTFCKDELRKITEFYCRENAISFSYGRVFYVYGRNEDKTRLTAMIIDKLSRDEKVVIKSGNLIKDYMYTKDIACAFSSILDSDVEGVVNICSAKAISIRDYALKIAKYMNKENLLVFEDEPSNQPPIIIGDNTRLIKEVAYELKYDLEKALTEILK